MTWKDWTAGLAVGAVLVIVGTRYVASRDHDEQVRREMHGKAQALKDEIDGRFPAGTPRSLFMEFARRQPGWQADAGEDRYISIGQEPSRVWYCGPWEVGVMARFKDKRLTGTEVSRWGLDCP